MKQFLLCIISLFALTSTSCQAPNKQSNIKSLNSPDFKLPYSLLYPDTTVNLAKELNEISGLAYSSYSNMILAVDDDSSNFVHLNPQTGIIEKISDFGKPDDYEGITSHNEMIYIVESNGNIKIYDEHLGKKTNEYNDILSKSNNIEGLAYDPQSNSLMLAAKGASRISADVKGQKSIFSMNPKNGQVTKAPYLKMNLLDESKTLQKETHLTKGADKPKTSKRLKAFAPSGIAIHPISKDLYILSAKGKLLVVYSQNRKLRSVNYLNSDKFPQPEGICFAPDGTLYIANEGKKGKATLMIYKPKDVSTLRKD